MPATYSSERLFSSEAFLELMSFVESPRPPEESLEGFERELRERTNAVSTAVMGERLAAMDVDEPQVLIDGEQFRRLGRHEKTYHTLSGDVVVERTIYVPSRQRWEGRGGTGCTGGTRGGLLDATSCTSDDPRRGEHDAEGSR